MKNDQALTVHSAPHPTLNYVVTEAGRKLDIPADWACLKPGDGAVTKTLKSLGPSWTAVRKKRRKTFSDGVWAPRENIEKALTIVDQKRNKPTYARKRAADLKRREEKQERYELSFQQALLQWLNFHPLYTTLAELLACAIASQATPIGSGTVARTERIPIEERAAAAAIAWMRHRTTAYDSMKIARIKGRRREIRRELARQSVRLLHPYRTGEAISQETCPLAQALSKEG